ncbi:hypothetical protein JYU34_020916 [Plutella xylostella]|uniref:Large ribosomal subunit protein mL52 n=1 Tax=Plutella xylostella TaxID=51655 RepID=A0ABQ7PW04_PLUXY|nr:hypothetical protein JYU34_020916 [Plutella xylostella]
MTLQITKHLCASFYSKMASRGLSCSPALSLKRYREQQGLPINKNVESVLTDGPDYTFLDGRPTPLLHKQKKRLIKQQGYASKIVELSAELDFAIERQQSIQKAKEQERQNILGNRLKPKGLNLLKKS